MFLPIFLYLHQKIPEERWFETCRAGVPQTVASDTFPGMSGHISRHENVFSSEDNLFSPIDNQRRKR